MSAVDEIQKHLAEEKAKVDEGRAEARTRYTLRLRQTYSTIVRMMEGSVLEQAFPGAGWKIIDLEPVLEKKAYGGCQPDTIISDAEETFYLAVASYSCSGFHWWWADSVATASGPCHWRLRDKGPGEGGIADAHGESNPSRKLIATWWDEKQRKVGGSHDGPFREKRRAAKLAA